MFPFHAREALDELSSRIYLGPRGPIGSMKKDVSGVRRPANATLKARYNMSVRV